MIAVGLLVGALAGLSVCVGKRELRRWRDAESCRVRFNLTNGAVMREPSDGEADDEPDEDEQLASLVGVPEGVGPPVRPGCPICTGGRGLPCAWHSL